MENAYRVELQLKPSQFKGPNYEFTLGSETLFSLSSITVFDVEDLSELPNLLNFSEFSSISAHKK